VTRQEGTTLTDPKPLTQTQIDALQTLNATGDVVEPGHHKTRESLANRGFIKLVRRDEQSRGVYRITEAGINALDDVEVAS
jgi:hypothetical protein